VRALTSSRTWTWWSTNGSTTLSTVACSSFNKTRPRRTWASTSETWAHWLAL